MYDYGYTTTYSPETAGAILALSGAWSMISLIIGIVSLVAAWKVFTKAGKPGWAALIPFYNTYTLFDIIYPGHGWRFLRLLIPIANIYFAIKAYLDLSKAYGQGTAFGIGLLLMSPVFMCILAFGNYEYQLAGSASTGRDVYV